MDVAGFGSGQYVECERGVADGAGDDILAIEAAPHFASFRPLRFVDPERQRAELTEKADHGFETLMREKGERLFWAEFMFVLARLRGANFDDPAVRLRAIRWLRPFAAWYTLLGLDDEDLSTLWQSLDRARDGDATAFKAQLTGMIA